MAGTAFEEATVKQTDDALLIRQLLDDGRIRQASPRGKSAKIAKDFRLDRGEAETIVLAQQMGAICGTDDGPAIRCLKVLGLPFTSAMALLVAMAESGRVRGDLAMELLAKLERYGRYGPQILEDAARRIRAAASSGEVGEKQGGDS